MGGGVLQHGPVFLERTRAKQVHPRTEALVYAQNIHSPTHGLASFCVIHRDGGVAIFLPGLGNIQPCQHHKAIGAHFQQARQALAKLVKTTRWIMHGPTKCYHLVAGATPGVGAFFSFLPLLLFLTRHKKTGIDAAWHNLDFALQCGRVLRPLPQRGGYGQMAFAKRIVFPQVAHAQGGEVCRRSGGSLGEKAVVFTIGVKPVAQGHNKGFGENIAHIKAAAHACSTANEVGHKAVSAQRKQGIARSRRTPETHHAFFFCRVVPFIRDWRGQPQPAHTGNGQLLPCFCKKQHGIFGVSTKCLGNGAEPTGEN